MMGDTSPRMNRGAGGSSLPWKRLVAELAVIVAGVLIALGAESWWGRRQERRQAEEYVRQLLVDFRETERQLQNAIAATPGHSSLQSGHRPRISRSVPPD